MKYQQIMLEKEQLAELLRDFSAWCENYNICFPDTADAHEFLETQFNDQL